jgi:hypothetical protein
MKVKNIFSILVLLCISLFAQAAISNPSQPNSDSCDVVAFKNGRIIRTKVIGINKLEIRFRDCANPKAAEVTHDINDVLSILYSNGSTADFSDKVSSGTTSAPNSSTANSSASNKPAVNPIQGGAVASSSKSGAAIFGIFAILAAVIGLWVAAIPLGVVAIILGAVGITKGKDKGDIGAQTIGTIGTVFGVIIFILGLISLSIKK